MLLDKNKSRSNIMKLLKNIVIGLLVVVGLTACNEKDNYVKVGPNWDALYKLDEKKSSFDIHIKLKKSYLLGDEMTLSVTSPKEGKLWVVYVDPNDKVSLMYPNPMVTDNTIKASNKLTIPADNSWAVEAVEPLGHSLIAFIVTTGDGDLMDVFKSSESKGISKAIRLVEATPAWSMEKHVVEVKKK